jgi:amino acid adenylation domain-containing protein
MTTAEPPDSRPFASRSPPPASATDTPHPGLSLTAALPGPTRAPLTEEQREIWLACQMHAGASAAYNESSTVRLGGAVHFDALQQAIRHVVARHEALRSVFDPEGAFQTILPSIDVELIQVALPEVDEEVAAWQRAECAEPFDLEQGPLVRFRFAPRGDGALFVVTAHHLVCDGCSFGTLLRELALFYNAAATSRPLPHLDPAPQISAYAAAEPARAASPAAHAALAYWSRRLHPLPEPPELPADRARPPRPTFEGDRETLHLPPEVSGALKDFARAQRSTFFSVLFSAFGAFLHRLTSSRDLVIGLPVAGQHQNGSPDLVGHCVKYLPVRQTIDPHRSFDEHLRAVSADLADALEHTQLTLGQFVRELRWPRDPSRATPIGIGFSLDPSPTAVPFDGLESVVAVNPRSHLVGEIVFNLVDRHDGLDVECNYTTDLFTGETVRRWLEHYATLLDAIVHAPSTTIAALPLLRPEERRLIVDTWNPSPQATPRERLVHSFFERNAILSPDAIAVEAGGTSVTYRELDVRANRLARHLVALGAGPDRCVALLIPRSIEFAEAVLGVLKAGAAYVPIDPSWPEDRQAFVIRDSSARALVTAGTPCPVGLPSGAAHVDLHDDRPHLDRMPAGPVLNGVEPEHVAYVIYTSGSTGEPKGVMVEHRSISAFIASTTRIGAVSSHDRALFFTSVSFDPSVEALFSPWSVGATVVMRGEELWTGREFAEAIRRRRITTVLLPVSYWAQVVREWAEEPGLAPLGQLRLVTAGGEAMPLATLRLWREKGFTSIRVLNAYGPTETTIAATVFEFPAEPHPGEMTGRVPIGKPFGPVEAYVLDDCLAPVPIGTPGELYLAGPTVSRGYLGRDALTRERFLPHWLRPHARMYRTGDRARFFADGTIDFLGRIDRQIKIRGFRIEPGEVEGVLARASGVRECAVVPAEESGGTILVGYFVAEPHAVPSESTLLDALRAQLPPYMVPARLVRVPHLPKNSSGKLDLRALAALGPVPSRAPAAPNAPVATAQTALVSELETSSARPSSADTHPASTDVEGRLRAIWCELLGTTEVAPDSDFFASGGHSMLAIRLFSRIEREFDVHLPMRAVFEDASFGALVRLIDRSLAGHPHSARKAGMPEPGETPVPMPAVPITIATAREPVLEGPSVPATDATSATPETAGGVETRLAALWRELLGIDAVRADTDFFAAGGHSLVAVRLVTRIEREFRVRVAVRELFEDASFGGLTKRILQRLQPVTPAPVVRELQFLVPIQPRGDRPPLFLCAGGHGSEEEYFVYALLTRSLGADQPVWGVRIGGHDRLEPLHRDAAEMAAAVIPEMRRIQPAGPYLLAGECVGGLLAFEIARQLEAAGATVGFLGLFDTGRPRFAEPLRVQLRHHWITLFVERAFVHLWRLAQMPVREIPAYVRGRGRWAAVHMKEGVAPAHVAAARMPDNPKDYHYFQTLIRYRPQTVAAIVTAFMSEDWVRKGSAREWARHTRGGVELVPLAGSHHDYIRAQARHAAFHLRACLDAVLAGRRPSVERLRGHAGKHQT